MATNRVEFTETAMDLMRKVSKIHGNTGLMFHQSGGCCDGSSPMCYTAGEFRVGGNDVMLGELTVDGVPGTIKFWMSTEQFEYWKHTHLTIDAIPGRGGSFSLESPEGMRFLTRSRMYTDEEWAELKDAPVLTGATA
jgi:uncharacterized protein (DUF779 family)